MLRRISLALVLLPGAAFAQDLDRSAFDAGRQLGQQVGAVGGLCCVLVLLLFVAWLIARGGAGWPVAIGVILFPYVFAWFTLREGVSAVARIVAFGWLALALCGTVARFVPAVASRINLAGLSRGGETTIIGSEPERPPEPSTTRIELRSEPSEATIRINGVPEASKTPATVTVPIGQELRIEISKMGYSSKLTKLQLAKGDAPTLDFQLQPAGRLAVKTDPPGARVAVGGQSADGVTPSEVDLSSEAPQDVFIHLDGYIDVVRKVAAKSGETTELEVKLEKGATIEIASDPGGAEVTVDGRKQAGLTPMNVGVKPRASHTVVVTHSRLSSVSRVVKSGAVGTSARVDVKLVDMKMGVLERAVAKAQAKARQANDRLAKAEADDEGAVRRTATEDDKLKKHLEAAERAAEVAQDELEAAQRALEAWQRGD